MADTEQNTSIQSTNNTENHLEPEMKYQLLGTASNQNIDDLLEDCADNKEARQRIDEKIVDELRIA